MMITSIKKIKDIGVFGDYEPKKTRLEKDFGKNNFIYGLNTYGKTTLCDMLKDISEDTTHRTNQRLSIPNGSKQEAIIMLSDGEGVVKLADNKWENNKLKERIMVFDTEFMINNVFDGTKLIEERETKENFTEFILGKNGVELAKEIEELKRKIKTEKSLLQSLIPNSQRGKTDAVIKKYALQTITEDRMTLSNKKTEIEQQLKNNKKRQDNRQAIETYSGFESPDLKELEKLSKQLTNVKKVLNKHYSISADTLVTFQEHINTACLGKQEADVWLKAGIEFLGEKNICPFCGQDIQNQNLLKSFSEYLNEDYQEFKNTLKKEINEVTIDWNVLVLAKHLIALQKKIDNAEKIMGPEVASLKEEIENIYIEVSEQEEEFIKELEVLRKKTDLVINSKMGLGNVSVELDTTLIEIINTFYCKKLTEVKKIVDNLNTIVEKVQKETRKNSTGEKDDEIRRQLCLVEDKLTRLLEDDSCKEWMEKFEQIKSLNTELKEKSESLENEQKEYLNLYFDKINQIFKRYGGRKFKIERSDFSNRGYKKIIGISVSYNETNITQIGHTESVFSESDKRALALAVFMAKLECIDDSECMNKIIVLDDPISSFDDNRMKLVITDLVAVSENVKQMFILSHHFMFSKMLSDRYLDKFNFYKINRIDTNSNGLYEINPKVEFLTGMDQAYNKIAKFNSGESNDMSENDLRIFLEEYLHVIFAKQYLENNLDDKKLGERIDELTRLNLISANVQNKLHLYRNELNSGSHTFALSTIEDDRGFSIDFIQYLFDNVHIG